MKKNAKKDVKLYNVFFPVWLLIWLPSYLWLILIPANYIVDTLVTWATLRGVEDRKSFCLKHTWKICLAGFLSDFVGSAILLGAEFLLDAVDNKWLLAATTATTTNPFSHPLGMLLCCFAIFVSAILIYFFDRRILTRAGLAAVQAKRTACWLAVITAPYLFLFPSTLLYY